MFNPERVRPSFNFYSENIGSSYRMKHSNEKAEEEPKIDSTPDPEQVSVGVSASTGPEIHKRWEAMQASQVIVEDLDLDFEESDDDMEFRSITIGVDSGPSSEDGLVEKTDETPISSADTTPTSPGQWESTLKHLMTIATTMKRLQWDANKR